MHKKFSFVCFLLILVSGLLAQNIPIPRNDTVVAFSQDTIVIDVLANDFDPNGDSIFIYRLFPGTGDKAWIGNNKVYLIPDQRLANRSIRYDISDGVHYDGAYIKVQILPNPDAPFAVADTFNIINLANSSVNVTANDYDPNNTQFKIIQWEKPNTSYNLNVVLNPDSLSFSLTPSLGDSAVFSYSLIEKNNNTTYKSDQVQVLVRFIQNPDMPQAFPDTAETIGGIPIQINVLNNDIDNQGDNFTIKQVWTESTFPGTVENLGTSIKCFPKLSYTGWWILKYRLQEVDNPAMVSQYCEVAVFVNKNPNCPVAVPDSANGITAVPLVIDVLQNDYDSGGDAFKIFSVKNGKITPDNKILYQSLNTTFKKDTLQYMIVQLSNSEAYSEWTNVYINLSPNPDLPFTNPDYVNVAAGIPVKVMPLANDTHGIYNSLYVTANEYSYGKKGKVKCINDTLSFFPAWQVDGLDSILYNVKSGNNPEVLAKGIVYFNIEKQPYYDSLTVNNINAGVNAAGQLFNHFKEFSDQSVSNHYSSAPHYKTPVNQSASTIFLNALWIGGYDQADSLHLAASYDWQAGPVSNVYDSANRKKSARLWKLSKSDIEFHRQEYNQQGYEPLEAIRSWPGNGDTTIGQAFRLAPFYDNNSDGIYNCLEGDYPIIKGDEAIFFIYNDAGKHVESNGTPLKVELHCMVYGFDNPADTALQNTVFVHYEIINRSSEKYTDCLAGIYTAFSIGGIGDDLIRCDVERGSFYAYNGDNNDAIGGYWKHPVYGDNPPAQAVTVLGGPNIDPDGIDNPGGGCDESVNGINFSNAVIDDERVGLSGFYFVMDWFPHNALEFYEYMSGMGFGYPLLYGGYGLFGGTVGPECRYVFPGNSDPLNYGTRCDYPNCGYNQTRFWTLEELGEATGSYHGVGSLGPFTLNPGQIQEIDLAYVTGHGNNGPGSSRVEVLRHIDSLWKKVSTGELDIANILLGLEPEKMNKPIQIYPNPTNDNITIVGLPDNHSAEFSIFNIYGNCIMRGTLPSGSRTIDLSSLPTGIYILKIKFKGEILQAKVVKI